MNYFYFLSNKLLQNSVKTLFLSSILLFISLSHVYSQSTFSGTGNWSDPLNWSAGIPDASTPVIIDNGSVCTVDLPGASCLSLSFTSNTANSSVIIGGTNDLTITGAINFSDPSANSFTQTFALGDGTLTCSAINFANTSNNTRTNTVTVNTGTLHVNGAIGIAGAANENYLTFTGAGIANITGNMAGTLTVNATSSTINIGGNFTGATFNSGTGKVNYNGAANQNVGAYTYNMIETNNGGNKILTGNTTINNTLTLNRPLDVNTRTLTLNTAIAQDILGTPTNLLTSASSSLIYNGNGGSITIPASVTALTGLTLNNTSGVTLGASLTTLTNLILTNGVLNNSVYNISLAATNTITVGAGSLQAQLSNYGTTRNLVYNTIGKTIGISNEIEQSQLVTGTVNINSLNTSVATTINDAISILNIATTLTNSNSLIFSNTVTQTVNVTGTCTAGTLNFGTTQNHTLNLSNTFALTALNANNISTINLQGTVDQSLPSSNNYYNIQLSNTGAKTLAGNVTIAGVLTLNTNLSIGNNTLSIGIAGTFNGTFGNTAMIITNGSGNIIKQGNNAADFIMTYPIGTGTLYSPFVVTSLTGTITPTATLTMRSVPSSHPACISVPNLLNKYWIVSVNNISGLSVSGYFQYNDPAEITGTDASFVSQRYTTVWNADAALSVDNVLNRMVLTNANTLNGEFTAADPGAFISDLNLIVSIASGPWNTASNWSPAVVPNLSTHNVIIRHAITSSTVARSINNLSIASGGSFNPGGQDFTVGGNLSIESGGALTIANANYTVTGTTTVNGTLTETTGTGTNTFTGNVTIGGTWNFNQNVNFGGNLTFNGISFTSSAVNTFTNNANIGGNQAYTMGTVTVNGGVALTNMNTNTVSGLTINTALNGAGDFIQGNNALLTFLPASIAITGFNASAIGNTVYYNTNAAQNIRIATYHHLKTNQNTKTLETGLITVNGDLTVVGGTLQCTTTNTGILTINGNLINSGTLTLRRAADQFCNVNFNGNSASGNGTYTFNHLTFGGSNVLWSSTSTINMYGDFTDNTGSSLLMNAGTFYFLSGGSQNINGTGAGTTTFNGLQIGNNNATVVALNKSVIVNGTLTINTNATGYLDLNAFHLTLNGPYNQTNNGQFNGDINSNLSFTGTVAGGTLRFINDLNLNNLVINRASGSAVNYSLGSDLNVNGNLNISGNSSTNLATLTLTGFNFNVPGTTTVNAYGVLTDNNNGGTNTFNGQVRINTGGSFTTANNSNFNFANGILNFGTFNISGGSGIFTISGSGITNEGIFTKGGTGNCVFNTINQTISGTSGLSINNLVTTGITVSNTNTAGLTIPGTISGTGNFTNGSVGFHGILLFNGTGNPLSLTGTIDFSSNANTVNYSSTGNQTIAGVAPSTTLHFYNLTISGARGGNTITLWNGGTIGIASVFSQIFTGGSITTTGSTVHFNGTLAQNIPALRPSNPQNYNNLSVSGGSIKTLLNSITVNSFLNLNGAVLELNSSNLTISNNAINAIQGSFDKNNMISTNDIGVLIKNAASLQTEYPIGSGGYYSKMTLTAIAPTTGTINVRAVPTAINPSYINTYWVVNSSVVRTSVTATFSYDPDIANGANPSISYSPDFGTTWQNPPTNGVSSFGTNSFTITGNTPFTGYWTLGNRTYYSYQTGDWDNPTTWTSDPSGTLQIGTSIPNINDRVIILSGRTVSLSSNVTTQSLNITIDAGAFLDQKTNRFTNTLTALNGQGTLKLSSIDLPVVTTNNFVNTGGGTVEYNNAADFTFPLAQVLYNNLTINAPGIVSTQMNNLTLNGDLYIKAGTFKINDNSSTQKRTLIVNGDVNIDNNGFIRVGNGVTNTDIASVTNGGVAPFINYYTEFHTVIFKGDFVNHGDVRFTNLSYPMYHSFPPIVNGSESGAASVYFQGNTDNTMVCHGKSYFYNLILDKGTDQTYKLIITSDNYDQFKLFGANALAGENSGTNANLRKALWIRTGTLQLEGSIIIPSLTEGITSGPPSSDYYLSSNAALILNGSDVIVYTTSDDYHEVNTAYNVSAPDNASVGISKGGNSAFVIYGKLQVSNGLFSTKESGGIITNDVFSGQFILNDGIVDTKQYLNSTGTASYNQSGGILILRGRLQRTPSDYSSFSGLTDFSELSLDLNRQINGINPLFGTFNLENANNIYTVSGGTVRIYDVCGINTGEEKAFDVKSSSSNINVTGGMLELQPIIGNTLDDATNFNIHTSAPLGSIMVDRINGTTKVMLQTNALTVLNQFTLNSGDFDCNNLDVTVQGNFTVESGTTYLHGTNTTRFRGIQNQIFTIQTALPFSLNNFIIDKPASRSVTFEGSQKALTIQNEFQIILAELADNGNTIYVAGNLYISGKHTGTGKIVMNGTFPQTISGNGIINNLELNNTDISTAPVSLLSNMTMTGELMFSQDKSFQIGIYNLLLTSSASISNSGTNRFIKTAGNAGDGGLTRAYSTSSAIEFPVGVSDYTPASIGFNTDPISYGAISVIPVNYEHPNVKYTGRSLSYFFRVKSTGFDLGTATVKHGYTYSESNVVLGPTITEEGYVAAVYHSSTNSWNKGTDSDVDEGANIIGEPGLGTFLETANFIDGDFTAGDDSPNDPFGSPVIYYSCINGLLSGSGLWSDINTWSFTGHDGIPAGSIPGASDIVIIGALDSVYLATNTTTPNTGVRNCATLRIESGSALDIGFNPACNFSMVLTHPNGNGNFRLTTSYTSGSTYAFPTGDFSDFNVNLGTTELYSTNPTSGTTYWLPNNINNYGNLILSPLGGSNIIFPNTDLHIYGNLTTRGQNADSWFCPTWDSNYPTVPNERIPKTITVDGDMNIQGGGLVWFGNGAITQNIVVYGDVYVAPLACIDVWSGATSQNMSIGGSLINNTTNTTPSGTSTPSRCDFTLLPVTFFGNTNAFISNTGLTPETGSTPLTIFETLRVDKGNSQNTTLNLNIGGVLTTPVNDWLTIENGTLRYMRTNPGTDFTISTSSPFTIPETAGLYIDYNNSGNKNVLIANFNTNTNDLILNGKLTVVNGNVYIGQIVGTTANNNDIEYAGGGNSALDIRGGLLFVNGQIRRPTTTTNGVLYYSQSGGNVVINGQAAINTYAKLEVLNTGSTFNMSGGTLTIVRGGGTTYGDLYLRPEHSTVTGGTIVFSQASTMAPVVDAVQNYGLDANISLYHLILTGKTVATARNAVVNLSVNHLILKGSLSLSNANSIFNTNNLNVTIGGDLANSGTYNFGTNLTVFNGSIQNISGTSVTHFYDLTVSPITSLIVNNAFTVNRNLIIGSGNLVLGNNTLTLLGNLTNTGSYTDNNVNSGIKCSGTTSMQQITGTGGYGKLDINNVNGVKLNNNISLQNNLVLTKGVLDINQYVLTLSQNSIIEGAPFNVTKMIKSDGVTGSKGVTKFVTTVPQSFTFPVGVNGKYTPAVVTITNNETVGSITVNPVNSYHVTVLDPTNVLRYYWEIESSGVSNFSGEILLSYVYSDVYGNESEYVSAKLEQPGDYWIKAFPDPATDNVDEINHQILFNTSLTNNLNGDYTAGLSDAIPDEVPVYRSNKDGIWSDHTIWTPVGSAPPCPPGGPNGYIVIVDHEVSATVNNCFAYKTTINGKLKIISPTFGHNLGGVDGDGTLYTETGIIPAGDYSVFTDCSSNGTFEYGGNSNYTIISNLYESVPNLLLSGTGSRIMYNKDLTICKSLVIDGPTLDNSINNRKLSILGTMEIYSTGIFLSGSGAAPLATVSFSGSSIQSLGGVTGNFFGASSFYNLEVNNSAGLNIASSGTIEVSNSLLLTNGLINTGATNSLSLMNTSPSSVIPSGGSTYSYINGPLKKRITNGQSFLFPLGKNNVKSHDFTLTSASGGSTVRLWTAEYFTPNSTPSSDLTSPLVVLNQQEYWTVNSTASYNAKVKIGWDAQSDLNPSITLNGMSDMRVAEFNTGTNKWVEILNPVTSGTITVGDVTHTNNVLITLTPKKYTIGAVSQVDAYARFTSLDDVCGNDGIPVTFTSQNLAIYFPYTLHYTIDGIDQDVEVVNSVPYILPTPVAGVYRLTGFTCYDEFGHEITGEVSNSDVTVYPDPTMANAGSDQVLCGLSGTNLNGNDPVPFNGLWSIVSGTGGSITNNISNTTFFSGILGNSYTLRWTISSGSCTSFDDVIVAFPVNAQKPGNFIEASTPLCQEALFGVIYTVPNVPGNTYNWLYSGTGATLPPTTLNSIAIDFSASATGGILSVTATNSCGTSDPRTLTIDILPKGQWIGDVDNNWFNPDNWSCPGIPDITSDVDIPAGALFMPTIGSTGAECKNITIHSGASLGLSGTNTLDVSGNWTNDGTFTASPSSIISFTGTTDISGVSENTFGNVTITGSLKSTPLTLNIKGNWTNSGTFNHNNGTIMFNGSTSQTITCPNANGSARTEQFRNFIVASGTDISLSADSRLTVTGTTDIQGTFTLKGDAINQSSFIDNGMTQTGLVYVERYLSPSKFQYLSIPFFPGGNAVSTMFTNNSNGYFNPNFYSYDESFDLDGNNATSPLPFDPDNLVTAWVFAHNGEGGPAVPLVPGKGYAYYNDVIKQNTYTGELSTGNFSIPINYTVNDPMGGFPGANELPQLYDGWNLVGNPYPSAIDWDLISADDDTGSDVVDNGVYAWNEDQYSGYQNGISVQKPGMSKLLAPMQGFFVHAKTSGNLSLSNSHRAHIISGSTLPLKGTTGDEKYVSNLLKLQIDANGFSDIAGIYFLDDATDGFDMNYDLLRLYSNYAGVPNLSSTIADGNLALSLNCLPEHEMPNKAIPLELKVSQNGNYMISVNTLNEYYGVNIYLNDKKQLDTINLRTQPNYSFFYETAEETNRFELFFKENVAPVLQYAPENLTIKENETFTHTFGNGLFKDPDQGDTIEYIAVQENGNTLPEWLYFNPNGVIFGGQPEDEDVGEWKIKLLAIDQAKDTSSVIFSIIVENVNHAPILNGGVEDIQIDEDSFFSLEFSSDLFIDYDEGDSLIYSVDNLPHWLVFDPEEFILTGIPTNDDVGIYELKIIASDPYDAYAYIDFMLTVYNVNDAPYVVNYLSDSELFTGHELKVNYDSVFHDIDPGDLLYYTVTFSDGSPLPEWIENDSLNLSLNIHPVNGDEGDYSIMITVHDSAGESASCIFQVIVMKTTDILDKTKSIVMAYPNPSDGIFKIIVSDDFIGNKYIVRSINGKIITVGTLKTEFTKLDMNAYDSGIYFVEIIRETGSTSLKLIIR